MTLVLGHARLAAVRARGGAPRPAGGPLRRRAAVALLAFNLAGLFENNWGDTEVQQPILFVLAIPFCLQAAERAEGEDERRNPQPAE